MNRHGYSVIIALFRISIFLGFTTVKMRENRNKYIDEAIDLLKESIKLNDAAADTYALLARAYGSKIGLNPMRGMDLGIRSSNAFEKAESLEPENQRVFLIAGISALFTSELFGGGIEKAKEHFLKAASFFEAYNFSNPAYPNWGQDDPVAAESYYQKALEIDPDYGCWSSTSCSRGWHKQVAQYLFY